MEIEINEIKIIRLFKSNESWVLEYGKNNNQLYLMKFDDKKEADEVFSRILFEINELRKELDEKV